MPAHRCIPHNTHQQTNGLAVAHYCILLLSPLIGAYFTEITGGRERPMASWQGGQEKDNPAKNGSQKIVRKSFLTHDAARGELIFPSLFFFLYFSILLIPSLSFLIFHPFLSFPA